MAEEPVTGAEGALHVPLSVDVSIVDDITVVSPAGEIDYSSGSRLREALTVAEDRPPRVVLDLSHVAFMDSNGITILLLTHKALGEAGGWLRIAGCTSPVARVVQLVGLDTVIPCFPCRQDALGA
ncbi:STAS domain-containing protein [Actinacidiphila acidipaludis]|uniref:Anti-sigma factor antagonist n=1 Tax=Actinacidiphila acidipaludis TaxID=2873382 RepID=A0ABS7Q2D4_9ACTN|nr:STAS domain-containing protein [Streptomyces acidipaludis]MBY8877298.1 STAS domain-containing protein [Streptomyces acidipaludis]